MVLVGPLHEYNLSVDCKQNVSRFAASEQLEEISLGTFMFLNSFST